MRDFLVNFAEACVAAFIAFCVMAIIGHRPSVRELLIGIPLFIAIYFVIKPLISRFFRKADNA